MVREADTEAEETARKEKLEVTFFIIIGNIIMVIMMITKGIMIVGILKASHAGEGAGVDVQPWQQA